MRMYSRLVTQCHGISVLNWMPGQNVSIPADIYVQYMAYKTDHSTLNFPSQQSWPPYLTKKPSYPPHIYFRIDIKWYLIWPMKILPNRQDYHQTSSDLINVFLLCCIAKVIFVSGFLYPQTNLYTLEVCFSFALHCQKYYWCSTFYRQKENHWGKTCPALGLGWFEAYGHF